MSNLLNRGQSKRSVLRGKDKRRDFKTETKQTIQNKWLKPDTVQLKSCKENDLENICSVTIVLSPEVVSVPQEWEVANRTLT